MIALVYTTSEIETVQQILNLILNSHMYGQFQAYNIMLHMTNVYLLTAVVNLCFNRYKLHALRPT
jgi:hypothetical protein